MHKFNPNKCTIPVVWCGEAQNPPKNLDSKYYKIGSRYECLKKGVGAGFQQNQRKYLPHNSLRQIKYVGEIHEKQFINVGINSTDQLIKEMKNKTSKEVHNLLKRILTKSDGKLDVKAYNSTLLFLYQNGNSGLPSCVKINPKL